MGQVCDKVLEAPAIKWALRIVLALACLVLVQTVALLWIASSLSTTATHSGALSML